MKELVEVIAKALVDNPDAVVVNESLKGDDTLIELKVAPADMGKANAREINAILTRLQGWQKSCVDARPYSSTARGFSRKPMQLV